MQAWRAQNWAEGVYSIIRFDLFAEGQMTRLVFTQEGFPAERFPSRAVRDSLQRATMSRRLNAALRCRRCRLHGSLCICSLIPRLETRTRLVLIMHRYEDRKPTNTGRLGAECLVNSEVRVRGHEGAQADALPLDDGAEPLLLFPHEAARPLTDYVHSTRPITLIVPDGTWRQASKVRQRVAGLGQVQCVGLPRMQPSTYRLRSEPREDGLATIEAIARAMGILEGEHVQRAMEKVFRAMVERTLWARGHIDAGDVASSIPAGVKRHDPASGEAGLALARNERPNSAHPWRRRA